MPDWFIRSSDDLLKLLDNLLAGTSNGAWWDGFFADESRRPFLWTLLATKQAA